MNLPDIPKNSVVTMIFCDRGDDRFWLDILVDGQPYHTVDFDTAGERQRAHDDLTAAMYASGGIDVSVLLQ